MPSIRREPGPVVQSVGRTLAKSELQHQDRQWSQHAERYDEVFLDPYAPGVENPLWAVLDSIPDAKHKTVADLGCGTGPLLPRLIERFERVIAPRLRPRNDRAGQGTGRMRSGGARRFPRRPMHELDDLVGQIDLAVAVNSLVMPDVRVIDRTLRAVRASLKPSGQFLGIVPSIDAIAYHMMLLTDNALDRGMTPRQAERRSRYPD